MRKVLALLLFLFGIRSALAQETKEYRYAITYVAASVVYVNAGREEQIAVGDTMTILHSGESVGRAAVIAVSLHSSAAQSLNQHALFAVGDEATIVKPVLHNQIAQDDTIERHDSLQAQSQAPQSSPAITSMFAGSSQSSNENIISGRVGIQYSGIRASDPRFNFSQPNAIVRLDVQNLFGTGMMLTLYGRSYFDMTGNSMQFGNTGGLQHRMYEMSLQRDLPGSDFGFGVGRMMSRYVTGLGIFDGAQFFYHYGNFTAGMLGGAQVMDQSLTLNSSATKGAFFLNYHSGHDFFHKYDGTIAYGRQMVNEKLDREFMYLQNMLSLGSELSFYETSEIELNTISNGVRRPALNLSNTYFSVNYYPLQWLSTNVGYDASRTVYLFETMKSFSDTLFDKNLLQGYRANITVRLPYFIALSADAALQTKNGYARDAHTLGGSIRMSDIAESDLDLGARYTSIVGVYSTGNDIIVDCSKSLFPSMLLSLRYDYYNYTIFTTNQPYLTRTATAALYYRMSRLWYFSISVDDVIDSSMKSYRGFAEIGIRF
jgi:hypothetical protein